METSIIDSLMLSEKRRDIMILLSIESKSRDEMAEALDMPWQLLKQPIKELKNVGMIFQKENVYSLSNNGRLMITALMPLLTMVDAFSSDIDYWKSRDLQPIPHHLTKRMGELGKSSLNTLSLDYMFEPLKHFIENATQTRYLNIVLSLFDPEAPSLLKEIADKDIEISLVFERNTYGKMNENFRDELDELNNYKNISFYCIDSEVNPPEIIINDGEMAIIFFNQNGKYDYRELLSSDENAIAWGSELFEYYKGISKPCSKNNAITPKP
ncbi:winged helix-turn-helix domain-containing protein [Methanolobus sp. ZRKC5]|uniref:helix-turn-helix transcriptional regulator n=1 Tax=Methanolobus sp. ZRKC5 TaxID=3136295 RepID=UPI00313AA765